MIIPVKVSREGYVTNVLKCLNPLLKLKPREIEVLSTILKYYFVYKDINEEDLYAMLFSQDMRLKIRTEIDMSAASYNNHLVQLKAKRMLMPTMRISPLLLRVFENDGAIKISYNITVTDVPGKESVSSD